MRQFSINISLWSASRSCASSMRKRFQRASSALLLTGFPSRCGFVRQNTTLILDYVLEHVNTVFDNIANDFAYSVRKSLTNGRKSSKKKPLTSLVTWGRKGNPTKAPPTHRECTTGAAMKEEFQRILSGLEDGPHAPPTPPLRVLRSLRQRLSRPLALLRTPAPDCVQAQSLTALSWPCSRSALSGP